MPPTCSFFVRGTCRNGDSCRFSHEPTNAPNQGKISALVSLEHTTSAASSKTLVCRFFSRGGCRRGYECKYLHLNGESPDEDPSRDESFKEEKNVQLPPLVERLELNPQSALFSPSSTHDTLAAPHLNEAATSSDQVAPSQTKDYTTRNYAGSLVTFSKGAEVDSVTPTSVSSAALSKGSTNRIQNPYLCCTYYKPSKIVYLHFSHTGAAKPAANAISGAMIDGRKVQSSYTPPNHFKSGMVISVTLSNVGADTSDDAIIRALRGNQNLKQIVQGKKSYEHSLSEAADIVRRQFERIGEIESWEPDTSEGSTKARAIVRFRNIADVARARERFKDSKLPDLGNSPLFVATIYSVKFSILRAIYRITSEEITKLSNGMWTDYQVHLRIYPSDQMKSTITARLYGENPAQVAKAKAILELIVSGVTALDGNECLWHVYFETEDSLEYLRELYLQSGGFIYRDVREKKFRLFGTAQERKDLESSLNFKVLELATFRHKVPLTFAQLQTVMQGGLKAIVAALGKGNASLNILASPQLVIRGSEADVTRAVEIIASGGSDVDHHSEGTDSDCCVCWTEAADAVKPSCGHQYCKECFIQQCTSAPDGGLPVTCFGEAGTCKQIISLADLERMLDSAALEKLLQGSFNSFVRQHPDNYQYCPTPDCSGVYTISTDGSTVICQNCLSLICTTCKVANHEGLTCEEWKDISSEEAKAFKKWKEENDVRDCPNCKMAIEKDLGCNHMECKACKTHICWSCMKTFEDSDSTYNHMTITHFGYYDEDIFDPYN